MKAQANKIDKIHELREQLLRGDMSRIARELGISRAHVVNVLHGRYFNKEIIVKALELRDLNRNTLAELNDRISA